PKSWQMRRQGQMLRRWCELSPRVWVYNYDYTMLVSALTPVPLTRKLARDVPLMKKWGCVGFADEARNQWAECGPQTKYVRARLKSHLEEAEQAAAKGDDRDRLHVRVDRLIYDHLRAYVAMTAAEFAGDFAAAAGHADRMLALRKELKAIDPFLMTDSERQEDQEYFYWGVGKRAEYYRKLADLTGGKTGRLVALLPERTKFRTDPHDDGRFAGWY